jgi:hypothetical protein
MRELIIMVMAMETLAIIAPETWRHCAGHLWHRRAGAALDAAAAG